MSTTETDEISTPPNCYRPRQQKSAETNRCLWVQKIRQVRPVYNTHFVDSPQRLGRSNGRAIDNVQCFAVSLEESCNNASSAQITRIRNRPEAVRKSSTNSSDCLAETPKLS